jgi:ElaA protein
MYRKTFEQLNRDELYAIMQLRQHVFVVEQNSVYLDLDGLDQEAMHYLIKSDNQQLIGYARRRILSLSKQIKFERIVLQKAFRASGMGKKLLQTMLHDVHQSHPDFVILLSSQTSACKFYRRLGFVEYGESYDDGGIEHIGMQFKP